MLLKTHTHVVPYGRPAPNSSARELETRPRAARPAPTWTWAALMRRAFDLDLARLSPLWRRMRLIATVHNTRAIRRILAHLGLACPGQPPGLAPPESSAAP